MKYKRVQISSLGYELPPIVVTSPELEERLGPIYEKLHFSDGQLENLTGIYERRWWGPDTVLSAGAICAARKALERSRVRPGDLGALLYTGVCREAFEPSTACRVADGVGVDQGTAVYDISNACLGVLNGIVDVANRIELRQIRAGLVVSCESAREIVDLTIERMNRECSMAALTDGLATLTGGSGAVAVLLTDGSFGDKGHQLLGGVTRVAPEFHDLCRWGLSSQNGEESMVTDSVSVLKHGVQLARETWELFLDEMGWTLDDIDRVICHQVGSEHQKACLNALSIPVDRDYATYEYLGNIGTVSLPMTAALADERGILKPGDTAAFLGIGSGLNCLMLGLEW